MLSKAVIKGIQLFLLCFNCTVMIILCLKCNKPPRAIPYLNHATNAVFSGFGYFNAVHSGVFAVIDLSVRQCEAEIAHSRIGGYRSILLLQFLHWLNVGKLGLDVFYRFMKLLCKLGVGKRMTRCFLFIPVHAFVVNHFTQHHVGIGGIIAVYWYAVLSLGKLYPFRLHIYDAVTLLQEYDICRDIRSGVG